MRSTQSLLIILASQNLTKFAIFLIYDHNNSNFFGVYRLFLIDWISRHKLGQKYDQLVKSVFGSLSRDGGVISSGTVTTVRENEIKYPHDLLFPFSMDHSRSRPFFDIGDFGTKEDTADRKIERLISKIGDKEISANTEFWSRPLTIAIREAYENILDHAIINSSKLFHPETKYRDIIAAEYWSIHIKRYTYNTNNPVFKLLPDFSIYHDFVLNVLSDMRKSRFSFYLLINMMDSGPGIYRYYNRLEGLEDNPCSLDQVIRTTRSTKKIKNAGGGTIHMLEITNSGGYLSFFSNNKFASYYFNGRDGGGATGECNTLPSRGTNVTIAIRYSGNV